jgi:2-dehydro-3-deoxy-L-rhamnonate dehydrogenase (NAD+)
MNQMDFNKRVAVVTGGAQGFGYAIAKRLLSSGAKVRIWDRDGALLDKSVKALGAGASGDALDVSSAAEVGRAAAKAIADLGRVDVLVNNAGVAGDNHKLIEYPIEEWERVLRINLTSQFLCCRALGAHMVAKQYGRIVNISSIAGKEGNPNAAAYSAAKAGVISLTKSLGKELARDGIVVTCVTPAAGRTAILDQSTPQHIEYMVSKIPTGRLVESEEVAALVCWLASEECSFSTGGVFDISGGRATY